MARTPRSILLVLREGEVTPALIAALRERDFEVIAARDGESVANLLDQRLEFAKLTGRSRAIRRVIDQVRAIASTRATVLIEGEPGTGKHLVAHSIHRNSPRRDEPFAWVSCGALPAEVIECELFGTGPAPGRFELADRGTLLLEDIAEAPAGLQFKLLRVVQDRSFERVGDPTTRRVDVRILASTDRDLGAEVAAGRFREDLFHRLSVVRLSLPPLRERLEDVAPLVEALVREIARARGRRITGVTRGVLDRLVRHSWPGNVRELRDTIDSMVQSSEGKRVLDLADLPGALREPSGAACEIAVGMTMEEAERILLLATLSHTAHDKPRAAAMLGIGLRTLYRKIKQFGLR